MNNHQNITQENWSHTVQSILNEVRSLKLYSNVPNNIQPKNHAFVVLGSALTTEGALPSKLVKRLEVTVAAIQKYPDSKVIVTGGPTSGDSHTERTEARAMREWLVDHQVDDAKIIEENSAGSTIDNALFSLVIAEDLNVQDVTIISCGTHMRRAVALFKAANQLIEPNKEKQRQFSNVIYPDFTTKEHEKTMSEREEAQTHHELTRTLDFHRKYIGEKY